MRLGIRARHAVRLMMGIGRLSRDRRPVSLGEVSHYCGVSRRYLDRLVVSLKRARLLQGRSGRAGGYLLIRPPAQITIGEIVEAAAGPVTVSECVHHPELCLQSDVCQCRAVWTLIDHCIAELLNQYSLADLLERWPGGAHHLMQEPKHV